MPSPLLDSDLELELELDLIVDVPRTRVRAAWTQPEHLVKWFCPRDFGAAA